MKRVNFFTSSMALGVYTPALIIHNKLKDLGIETRFFTFEEFFYEDKKEKLLVNKKLYHENPKVALLGQKFIGNVNNSLERSAVSSILNEICNSGKDEYIFVFSGLWMPELHENLPKNFWGRVTLFHMDSVVSPSWKDHDLSEFKTINFFDHHNRQINYYLDVDEENPMNILSRRKKIIIHGGGWGMGNYKEAVMPLLDKGFELDHICYYASDVISHPNVNNYLLDQDWKAWERNLSGSHTFPSICKISDGHENGTYIQNAKYHEAYNLTKSSVCIISKPGGGTLVDSFSSETPIVFMSSVGKHEDYNKFLWEHLNFGIDFEASKNQPDLYDMLVKMSLKMKEHKSTAKNIMTLITEIINLNPKANYATQNEYQI